MKPVLISAALPKLAAYIDEQRPLISAALLDLRITAIEDEAIVGEILTDHSFQILTSPGQQAWLHEALRHHFGREMKLTLTRADELPLHAGAGATEPDKEKLKRVTLNFTQREALKAWMQVEDNTILVTHKSDKDGAEEATRELEFTVTAANIAGMRKLLSLDKIKPNASPPAPADIDLVALFHKVEAHDLQLGPIAANNLGEMLANLRDSIHRLELRIVSLEA